MNWQDLKVGDVIFYKTNPRFFIINEIDDSKDYYVYYTDVNLGETGAVITQHCTDGYINAFYDYYKEPQFWTHTYIKLLFKTQIGKGC
jgi:hypothetical protein